MNKEVTPRLHTLKLHILQNQSINKLYNNELQFKVHETQNYIYKILTHQSKILFIYLLKTFIKNPLSYFQVLLRILTVIHVTKSCFCVPLKKFLLKHIPLDHLRKFMLAGK